MHTVQLACAAHSGDLHLAKPASAVSGFLATLLSGSFTGPSFEGRLCPLRIITLAVACLSFGRSLGLCPVFWQGRVEGGALALDAPQHGAGLDCPLNRYLKTGCLDRWTWLFRARSSFVASTNLARIASSILRGCCGAPQAACV